VCMCMRAFCSSMWQVTVGEMGAVLSSCACMRACFVQASGGLL
jgi:hypothetical protein